MNKVELIDAIVKTTGGTKAAVGSFIDALESTIVKTVKKGDSVRLMGFGSFTLRKRKSRKGRNPQTGAPMTIKAGKTIGFTAHTKARKAL